MSKRRLYSAVLLLGALCLLIMGAGGLWLRSERRQEACNRQLIAALAKSDMPATAGRIDLAGKAVLHDG